MRTVVLIGPFFGGCEFAPSPAKRMTGYARYLPALGWRPIVVAPACRCLPGSPFSEVVEVPGEGWVFDPLRDAHVRRVEQIIDQATEAGDALVLRPVVRASRSYRLWSRAAVRSDDTRVLESRMSRHWLVEHEISAVGGSPSRVAGAASFALGAYTRVHGAQTARYRALAATAGVLARSAVRPEAVVGSHGYAAEVRAAARLVDAAPGSPRFVVEFRDAIARGWRPAWEAMELARVYRTVRRADAVVHVTEQEQHHDARWIGAGPVRAVIEAGFDPEVWDEARRSAPAEDRFVLRFVGTLHPQRDLGLFGAAFTRFLGSLAEEDRSRVVFEYIGRSVAEAERWRSTLGSYRDRAVVVGEVPRAAAIGAIASAAVLVLPTFPGAPGGRFYEYLGSKRPVLAIGARDDYVANALRTTRTGAAVSDALDGSRVLDGWFDRWRSGASLVTPSDEALDRFSRRQQAARMAELLAGLVSGRVSGA